MKKFLFILLTVPLIFWTCEKDSVNKNNTNVVSSTWTKIFGGVNNDGLCPPWNLQSSIHRKIWRWWRKCRV